MELTLRALADTAHAFDGVAPRYGQLNADNPIICAMRGRALAALTTRLSPGSALLDLGCGPGLDAVRLAAMGYRVTAIDSSAAMVTEARERLAQHGLTERATVLAVGIHEIDRFDAGGFDGAFSNFGPFNCVPDLPEAARALSTRLRPGGVLVASVIGRVCPWEIARYGVGGDWRRVGVRFSKGFVPVPLEGRTVWTRYYRPGEFTAPFRQAGFRVRSIEALGLCVPPPYMQHVYERYPRLMSALGRLERGVAGWPGFRLMGDHFLVTLTRG